MTIKTNRFAAVAVMALVASLGLAGCGSDDSSTAADGGDGGGGGDATTVTFIPKNLGNPYFDTSDAGGKKAVEEFGGTYAEVGPDAGRSRRPGPASSTPRPSRASTRW